MSGKQRRQPRKPATKLTHLQKKMQKQAAGKSKTRKQK